MTDCPICCEKFKGHAHKKISCKHCNFKACKTCNKTYILNDVNQANCMNCRKTWDREFLVQEFSYTWVNGPYKKHREELLFDLERAKFEETQRYIEKEKLKIDLQKEIQELKEEKENIKVDLKLYNSILSYSCVKQRFRELEYIFFPERITNNNYYLVRKGLIAKKYKQFLEKELKLLEDNEEFIQKNDYKEATNVYEIDKKLRETKQKLANIDFINKEKEVKEKFYGHCPQNDCKGFINNTWRCGICNILVCKSCKEFLTKEETDKKIIKKAKDSHECDPNTLASLEQVKKDTKPCPKCKIPISRISGCTQMWCTECHVAFDWKTGNIVVTGNIHNPHYFEWQRRTGRQLVNEQDICNRRIPHYSFNVIFQRITPSTRTTVENLLRFSMHIEDIVIRNINRRINSDDKWMEYRVQFMKSEITEDKFKKKIQWREKRVQKEREFGMIWAMFANTIKDLLYENVLVTESRNGRVVFVESSCDNVLKFQDLSNELIKYTNESFLKLKDKYKNKVPQIIETDEIDERQNYKYKNYDTKNV